MKILPFEEFIIKTSFNTKETTKRLKEEFGTNIHFGEVNNNYFEIKKRISGNSFSPIIEGEICSNFGITLKIKIKLRDFSELGLMTIFISFIIAFLYFIVSLIFYYKLKKVFITPLGITFGLFGLYLISLLSFKFEAYRAKKRLMRIFK